MEARFRSTALRTAGCVALLAFYAWLLLGARATLWHDALVFPCVLWLSLRLIEPTRAAGLALLATAALAVNLLYVWYVGFGGRNHVFAGIFALSDAGTYYWDAERVLHGVPMNSGGARRPIFSAVLAGVLRLLGNDIRLAHVLTMVVWAACGALATREVWRTHGRNAGSLVFVIFVLFARRYVGFVQSEGVGAPLGALAFALIWRARSMKSSWQATYLGGLALQAVALLARPGPVFAIAGIVVWAVHRSEKTERAKLLMASLAVVASAFVFQSFVRAATTTSASFSDLPLVFYGLLQGEDAFFAANHDPSLAALPQAARDSAIWHLVFHGLAERPWLVVLAPLECLASWFCLPQGFFGFVWLNPDDRVLENAALVSQSVREHGYLGPIVLWVQRLGAYSFSNAITMAGLGLAFLVGLLRAAWKAIGAWRRGAPPFFAPVLLGMLASLPLLPPWITEGAQIFASVFFFVVAFVVTGFLPPREPIADAPASPRLSPRLAVVALGAMAVLVAVAKVLPVRAPTAACSGDGRYLADVDWRGGGTFGGKRSPRALADEADNIEMLRKYNAAFARSIQETASEARRIVPAYDVCSQRMLYVVGQPGEFGAARERAGRWTWLRTTPMAQWPLELSAGDPDPNR